MHCSGGGLNVRASRHGDAGANVDRSLGAELTQPDPAKYFAHRIPAYRGSICSRSNRGKFAVFFIGNVRQRGHAFGSAPFRPKLLALLNFAAPTATNPAAPEALYGADQTDLMPWPPRGPIAHARSGDHRWKPRNFLSDYSDRKTGSDTPDGMAHEPGLVSERNSSRAIILRRD
jgi:hypothetical protein